MRSGRSSPAGEPAPGARLPQFVLPPPAGFPPRVRRRRLRRRWLPPAAEPCDRSPGWCAAQPEPRPPRPGSGPVATAAARAGTAAGTATGGLSAATGLAQVLDLLRGQARAGALGPGQPPGGGLGDTQIAVHVRGGGIGLRRFADAKVQRPVDEQPAGYVVPVHERDRGAGVARPARAADAVHVGLLDRKSVV